jgi:hypothetical protein
MTHLMIGETSQSAVHATAIDNQAAATTSSADIEMQYDSSEPYLEEPEASNGESNNNALMEMYSN